MPTFAAVIDVVNHEIQNAQEFATLWGRIRNETEQIGSELNEMYALLGGHDFLVVFDAPDITHAFQVSLIVERYGLTMETMVAIPVDQMGELVEEI